MNDKVKAVLSDLEAVKHRRGNEFWNVPRATAEFLGFMVRVCGARKVLEIGTSNGYSGLFIAEALSHSGGLLYTVESNRARHEAAAENFRKAGLGDFVRQVLGHAPEVFEAKGGGGGNGVTRNGGGNVAAGEGEKKGAAGDGESEKIAGNGFVPGGGLLAQECDFDLVFIDATKGEYVSYLEAVLPKLRRGGLVIADNCVSHRAELNGFFRYIEGRRDLTSVLLPLDNGIALIIRNYEL